jgi:hypothetical protein
MELSFGIWDVLFVFAIFFLAYRDLKSRFGTPKEHRPTHSPPVEDIVPETVFIRTEVSAGQIYIWNSATNVFLAQGKTLEDAIRKYAEHSPNTILKIKATE